MLELEQEDPIPQGDLALQITALPRETNGFGDIFGGWLVAQMDLAGATPAFERANGRCATVALDGMVFHQPVSVGDIVSFYADVTGTGRTSIKVRVEVYAERNPMQPITVKVTDATLTYVAITQQGEKRELPSIE